MNSDGFGPILQWIGIVIASEATQSHCGYHLRGEIAASFAFGELLAMTLANGIGHQMSGMTEEALISWPADVHICRLTKMAALQGTYTQSQRLLFM